MLEHELQEVPTHPSRGIMGAGAFYGARYTARGPKGLLNKILPFEISADEPSGPFAASAVWVPVTAAIVRVPEAALPRMTVGRKDRHGRGNPDLDDAGLPGFRIVDDQTPPELRTAMLLPAPSAPPAFPPGGTLVPETDMYVEVVDGVAALWNRVRSVGRPDVADLTTRGVATARQVGLLPA